MRLSRRTLLAGAAGGGGLLLAYALWPRGATPALRASKGVFLLGPGISVGSDGRVTIAVPQVETGQGIWTGLAQVAADELGAAWDKVAVAPALPSGEWANGLAEEEGWLEALGPWERWRLDEGSLRITAGSTSVRAMAAPMRQLGAAARALLKAEAGERWGVAPSECDAADGFVLHEGKRLAFGELAEGAATRSLPSEAPLRSGRGPLIGRPLPRLDAVPKARGSLRFAGDVRLPHLPDRSMIPAAMALVGEPTRVARPPIEAAKAIPIASAPAKPSVWAGAILAEWSTASAIGIMISAVAVFETIMEMSAVAHMKASSIAAGVEPPRRTIARARRR